jgi:predicted amino acid dehydrogenase
MQIIDQTVTVGAGGQIALQVPRPVGARVRVIVLEGSDAAIDETMALVRLQEASGFARQVLANPAEDVWNDL